jgi:hypothetical protein
LLVARHLLPKAQEARRRHEATPPAGVDRPLAEPGSTLALSAANGGPAAAPRHVPGDDTIELLGAVGCLLLIKATLMAAQRRRRPSAAPSEEDA